MKKQNGSSRKDTINNISMSDTGTGDDEEEGTSSSHLAGHTHDEAKVVVVSHTAIAVLCWDMLAYSFLVISVFPYAGYIWSWI